MRKMISISSSSFTLLLLLLLLVRSVTAQWGYECHLCRSPDRRVGNRNAIVDTTEVGGDVFTCAELDNFARNGEFGPQSCAIAQTWADRECECFGAPITPAPVVAAGACLICGSQYQIMGFPTKIVQTTFGPWQCSDLFEGGLNGFFSSSICPILQREAQDACGCREQYPSPAPTMTPAPTRRQAPMTPAPTPAPIPPTPAPFDPANPPVGSCGLPGTANCFLSDQCCSKRCAVQEGRRQCIGDRPSGSMSKCGVSLAGNNGGAGGRARCA